MRFINVFAVLLSSCNSQTAQELPNISIILKILSQSRYSKQCRQSLKELGEDVKAIAHSQIHTMPSTHACFFVRFCTEKSTNRIYFLSSRI